MIQEARTNKLECDICKDSIKKGEEIVFDEPLEDFSKKSFSVSHFNCLDKESQDAIRHEIALEYAFRL